MIPWHLINLLAQGQPLEGISNWPLKLLFLTLGQFSFVLTMQNIIFPIFGKLIYFIWDHHKTTWRFGWIISSPSNMPIHFYWFYHLMIASLRAFLNDLSDYVNTLFPNLASLYFTRVTSIIVYDTMGGYSVHQGIRPCYLINFIIKITPPCRHFKMPFQFPESNTTNFLVF